MPIATHCAFKSKYAEKIAGLSFYNFLANLLDSPAGAVPITHVMKSETLAEYVDDNEDNMTRIIREDIKSSEGMPLGVQIMGLPFEDETVLSLLEELQGAVKF